MRPTIKYFLLACAAGMIGMSSCKQKIDDAYANPNAAVRQPVELIFPSLIGSVTGSSSAAGSAYGLCADGLLIGRYIRYWGTYVSNTGDNLGTQYDRMGGTVGVSDNLGSMWAAHYYGMGQNINRIIEWGLEEDKWDFVGAAWAMRAWSMFETTNQYGEIILRQAFNTNLQQFTYEDQSEVYDSVRQICYRALVYLNLTGGGMNATNFTNSDFYFNKGDLNKWRMFVCGILARSFAYVHNKVGIYKADSVIKYADLSCQTNADNISAKFSANTLITGTCNYFGSSRGNVNNVNTGIRQSAYIADLMSGVNSLAFTGVVDPRTWYMLRENTTGNFRGFSPSYTTAINPTLATVDRPQSYIGTGFDTIGYVPKVGLPLTIGTAGKYIFRDEAEFPIMTASEMQFLKAEAALRKTVPDYPASKIAYVNAITMNFDMLTTTYPQNVPAANVITPASKAAYLANTAIVPAAATSMTLTRIMLQKYIALYGWGVQETWADMRRYHYNNLDPATGQQVYANFVVPSGTDLFSASTGSNNTKLVYRCRPRYNSEYLYNIPALSAIGAFPVGNDYHTKETWFSKP